MTARHSHRGRPRAGALLVVLAAVWPASARAQDEIEKIHFVDAPSAISPAERPYVQSLREVISSELESEGFIAVGALALEDLPAFIEAKKVRYYIAAQIRLTHRGDLVKYRFFQTGMSESPPRAAAEELFPFTTALTGGTIGENERKLQRDLRLHVIPMIEVLRVGETRELVLAHCIWPESDDDGMWRLSHYLTSHYPAKLEELATAHRYEIRSFDRLEVEDICVDKEPYPLESLFDHTVWGWLTDGGRTLELYWDDDEATLEEAERDEMARKIAEKLLQLSQEP